MSLDPYELQQQRARIHRHNGIQGHIAMDLSHMRGIQTLSTTTAEAKALAHQIERDLVRLAVLCKERVDP